MVPKRMSQSLLSRICFRAVLFRMVPKHARSLSATPLGFRAVLFRMVPKPELSPESHVSVLELCCFEWFQNGCPRVC